MDALQRLPSPTPGLWRTRTADMHETSSHVRNGPRHGTRVCNADKHPLNPQSTADECTTDCSVADLVRAGSLNFSRVRSPQRGLETKAAENEHAHVPAIHL